MNIPGAPRGTRLRTWPSRLLAGASAFRAAHAKPTGRQVEAPTPDVQCRTHAPRRLESQRLCCPEEWACPVLPEACMAPHPLATPHPRTREVEWAAGRCGRSWDGASPSLPSLCLHWGGELCAFPPGLTRGQPLTCSGSDSGRLGVPEGGLGWECEEENSMSDGTEFMRQPPC